MYRFDGRTVQPFLASAPEGYGNSTSRWQTSGQIRALTRYYTVIPRVTQFIITTITKYRCGSLDPTYVPVRYIYLTVRPIICSYTHVLISNQDELTFESLRYSLEGCRPNQTVSNALFLNNESLFIYQIGISLVEINLYQLFYTNN